MERDLRSRAPLTWLLAGCLALMACLGCLAAAGTAGLFVYQQRAAEGPAASPTARPFVAAATATASQAATPAAPPNPLAIEATATATATLTATRPLAIPDPEMRPGLDLRPAASIIQEPVAPELYGQLEALLNAEFPIHDSYEAARRLSSYDVGPRTITTPPYEVGDRQRFYTDGETMVDAILMAVTDHAYFWVDERLSLDQVAVAAAAERFEEAYYPRLVNLFGQEWQPGVDNDPHFSVLHLSNLESPTDELGHFNSGDEYPRSFYSVSNQQEIIYLNMGNLTLGTDLYFGTLVHEFQHLSQWYVDANETAWLNEGLSQLAELYVGLETAESVDYLLAPDTQLNTWDYSADNVYAHYGASYLFTVYLWEQLGEAAIQELARQPANGLAAINAVLEGYRPEMSLEQLVGDWAVANYLDDPAAGPAYHYTALELDQAAAEARVRFAPHESVRDASQFGVHYVNVDLSGETTVSFAGDTLAELAPVAPHSGEKMWFAPAQENVHAQLTAGFDLTELNEATLSFWTWYDLKFDLDYAYVTISTDGGQSWEILRPANARTGEYGPAFNGASDSIQGAEKGGWTRESITLDSYAGQPVLIRFELLTYHASNARGLALDDITIPELAYGTDVEDGADGWEAAGFVRVGRWLPQRWQVRFIHNTTSHEVVALPLNELNQGRWTLELGAEGGVLVISPLTPFVYEPASYWLFVEQ